MHKVIKNAKLVEIRSDGAQKYEYDDPTEEFPAVWLTGIQRASNPEIGMVGDLVYRKFRSGAWFMFRRYPIKRVKENEDDTDGSIN